MENTMHKIQYRLSQGNMHIALSGHFDEDLAEECIACVSAIYPEGGRIFLDTRQIESFCEKAINIFKQFFAKASSLAVNLYLKGEKGFNLLPEGGKLLIMNMQNKEHGSSCACGGKCGGANAKSDGHTKAKCEVCKCALAKARASQKQEKI